MVEGDGSTAEEAIMDLISESRLQLVCPALSAKIHTLAEMLSQEQITIRVSQGLRSWADQDKLYAQGRTAPGAIVTNAPGGTSWHNFGLAVDCVIMNPDSSVDWDAAHPAWKRMQDMGVSLGLVSGATWTHMPDPPHFQLTGRFPVSPDDEVRQIFKDGGMESVWREAGIVIFSDPSR